MKTFFKLITVHWRPKTQCVGKAKFPSVFQTDHTKFTILKF